jgi:Zn-dependent protease with chaperone function
MQGAERGEAGKDGVNDYYVKGESKQGVTFYLLAILVLALVAVLALQAYVYVPYVSMRTLWSAAYLVIALAVGATAGIFAHDAFARYKIVQIMLHNSLKASPHSFPEVFDTVKLAAERLSMEAPDTFITQNPSVNAYMVRMGLARRKKVIMINTGLLRAMEGDELLFIIGHELSHIKYGRLRRFKKFGIPYLISPQFNEFRCDRGGLAASGDIGASSRALLKLVTGREYIDRVDMKSLERERSETPSKVLQMLSTHPMIGARVKELLRFRDSPAYKKVMSNADKLVKR